ncbi:MAG: hypothetical protein K0M45_01860, partial [Candidatus Paracaedibacteraceae bacterium]|nr:hypothetical protein [Candidatus Paracaedibacteraceae bacterium]
DVKSLFPLFVPILSCSPPLPLKEGIWDRSLYQFFFGALYHFISGGDIVVWVAILLGPIAYLYGFCQWIYSRKQIAAIKKQMAINSSEAVMK